MSAYTSIKPFILNTLAHHLAEIQAAYGIDLLSTFAPAYDTFDTHLALAEYLETLPGRKVDLISPEYLKPRIRTRIEKDAITCGEVRVSA